MLGGGDFFNSDSVKLKKYNRSGLVNDGDKMNKKGGQKK